MLVAQEGKALGEMNEDTVTDAIISGTGTLYLRKTVIANYY
jgi:hypothetical protein